MIKYKTGDRVVATKDIWNEIRYVNKGDVLIVRVKKLDMMHPVYVSPEGMPDIRFGVHLDEIRPE